MSRKLLYGLVVVCVAVIFLASGTFLVYHANASCFANNGTSLTGTAGDLLYMNKELDEPVYDTETDTEEDPEEDDDFMDDEPEGKWYCADCDCTHYYTEYCPKGKIFPVQSAGIHFVGADIPTMETEVNAAGGTGNTGEGCYTVASSRKIDDLINKYKKDKALKYQNHIADLS